MGLIVDDLVLNPAEVEPEGVEGSFSAGGLSVKEASFGESKVSGTLVKTPLGVRMVDREPDTRTITLKLIVREDAGEEVTLPQAAHYLETLVAELQSRDRWLRRDFHVGGDFKAILYHVTGEVSLNDFAAWQVGASPDVTLTMVCDFAAYSTVEVEHGPFETEPGDRHLAYELPASDGTAKGLERIQVTNAGDDDWRGLIWSREGRYYKPGDPTALPHYEAKDLTPRGGAEVKTVEGAEVVQHTGLTEGRLAILGSEIPGLGHMTHRGPRRMWMRLEQPSGGVGDVKLQLLWRALGASRWTEDNPIISPRVVGGYCLVDFGECRPQEALVGDERWEWLLTGWAPGATPPIQVRDVYPLSTEQYMECSESYDAPVAQAQSNKSPGTMVGSTPDPGPAWANPNNAKADDGSFATVELDSPSPATSDYLVATNHGFELPSDAEILRVLAIAHGVSITAPNGSNIRTRFVDLVIPGEQMMALDSPEVQWTTEENKIFFEATSDMWEGDPSSDIPSLDPSIVNHEDFGWRLTVTAGSSAKLVARVNAMFLGIYFNEEPGDDRVCFASRSIELASDGVTRQHRNDDVWGTLTPDGFLPFDQPGVVSRGILIPSQGDLRVLADSGDNPFAATAWTRAGGLYAAASPA